jgi:hypothetical protein
VVTGGLSAGNNGNASYFGGAATFAGAVTVSSSGTSPAKMGTGFASFAEFSNATGFGAAGTYALIQDNTGETYLNTAAGKNLSLRVANANALVLTATTATFSGALKLGNAYVGTPVVSTGYITIQDNTGTTYKVAVSL